MNRKNILSAVAAVVLAAFCGVVTAQTSSTATNKVINSQPSNNKALQTSILSMPGLNTMAQVAGAISGFMGVGGDKRTGLDVKRYSLSNSTGAAAAPGSNQWNAWGAFSRSNISYDYTPLQSSGHVNVYLGGVDYTFDNNVIFGVAVARDDTDIDLTFSGGKLTGKGWTVSPYLGIPINKNLAFDATIGFGRTDIDTTVGTVAGSTNNDRSIGALGLTYREVFGAWSLSGRGAFLAVHDKLGAYTLSNGTFVPDGSVNVSQLRFTGQVAYTTGAFTPFVQLTYINDINRPDQAPIGGVAAANDRDAWTPAIGIRFNTDKSVYGIIQYSSEQSRSQVKNDQFLFNLGIRF